MSGTVLITGATGYLGGRCADALEHQGFVVRRGARGPVEDPTRTNWVFYGDLAGGPDLRAAVAGCEAIVHFAGHAHVPETPEAVGLAKRTNVDGTTHLVRAAIEAGVKRFVFISSALVLAGGRDANGVITDQTPPCPLTAYARTKLEAEQSLQQLATASHMEWVILRPSMVYGPHAPGNFQRLLRLVAAGLPLPLGRATAPKSFLYVDNLVSAVRVALNKSEARNRTFLVADAEITSTAGLIQIITEALGPPVHLLPVPEALCRFAATLLGRRQDVDRLFEPLVLDTSEFRERTGWVPDISLQEAIRLTIEQSTPSL